MEQVWANRAASAEAAVTHRHLERLWALPGTQLGVVAWPPARRDRLFGHWHYWWQAHLLDCLVDAQLRDPKSERRKRIRRQIRSHRLRNVGRWVNDYYDDMAWLALALERASRVVGIDCHRALDKLTDQFVNAWVPEDGGGIPWRKQDQFFNAPANGPAAIFLARYGNRLKRAQQMADWIDATLIDPETHLVFDGIKGGSLVRAQYTYCQGVVLGLETELAARTGDPRHAPRVHRLVAAVNEHMAPGGVISGAGGGDGGLFAGITARYLALVATTLPGPPPRTSAPGIPRARWCCPQRPQRGTTVRRSTGCLCSVRFGIAPPNCPQWPASGRNSSRAPSPDRKPPNGISRYSCPGGC